jgi:drug/metabolite transporter (DMT)-like permease
MSAHQPGIFKVYTIAILAMLFWGLSFVWSSIVLQYYSPIATIFLRLVISTAVLFFFLKISGKMEKIKKEDFKLILISAFFNPFLYFLGENYGLKLTSPTIASVIIATIPVFAAIAARVTLKERLHWINVLGIAVSFSGIIIMLINKDMSFNSSPIGIGMLLFAVASAVTYSVFLKRLTLKHSSMNIIFYQNAIGIVLFLPVFLVHDLKNVLSIIPDARLITALLLLAVFASTFAFVFFTMTVKSIGVTRANVFSNLIPVFTGIFSFIFISEIFTLNKIFGMIIVITGVFITQTTKSISRKYKGI